jgi:hypothetical protein
MKPQFLEYLNKIGITAPELIAKVDGALALATKLCPEDIQDIFINDYINQDGSREYEEFDGFSEHFMTRVAPLVPTPTNCSMLKLIPGRATIQISPMDYDFEAATEKSRLVIEIDSDPNYYTAKAAKANCDHLWEMYNKYLFPAYVK